MSEREAATATPAGRIEDVRRSIPPPEGRRSRLGYISKDDFADLLGAGRTTVIKWTSATKPSYPEPRYRVRLAELSEGRYTPEDFAPPGEEQSRDLLGRLAALEAAVEAGSAEVADSLARLAADIRQLSTLIQRGAEPGRKAGP